MGLAPEPDLEGGLQPSDGGWGVRDRRPRARASSAYRNPLEAHVEVAVNINDSPYIGIGHGRPISGTYTRRWMTKSSPLA